MAVKVLAGRPNPADHSALEIACAKRIFHGPTDRFPPLRPDARVHAAIGENFDVPIGEQEIDEHAVVVLGIPYVQTGEHLDSAILRGDATQEVGQIQ